ncbi:hypothetical protein Mpsy_2307 [Methanolobus psychrophilus R15]|nr:hypothetical protein Mpsy_2307 [Methanolobus psychrophilus R15]
MSHDDFFIKDYDRADALLNWAISQPEDYDKMNGIYEEDSFSEEVDDGECPEPTTDDIKYETLKIDY